MENKHVGYLIIGIAVLLIVIIFLYQTALKEIIEGSCSLAHGDYTLCPMTQSVNQQTYLSLGVVGLLLLIGVVLIFNKPKEIEKIIVRKVTEKIKKKKIDLGELNKNEKEAVRLLQESDGMFQAELKEKLGVGKVGLTRMLDKLEAKQIIERKRRGMNNFVVLRG